MNLWPFYLNSDTIYQNTSTIFYIFLSYIVIGFLEPLTHQNSEHTQAEHIAGYYFR